MENTVPCWKFRLSETASYDSSIFLWKLAMMGESASVPRRLQNFCRISTANRSRARRSSIVFVRQALLGFKSAKPNFRNSSREWERRVSLSPEAGT